MPDTSLYRRLTARTRDSDRPFAHLATGENVTYRRFHQRCDQMADALYSLGVAAGDRVVVQVDKSLDAVILYMASLRVGAIYVPLDPTYTASEVAFYLADADATLYVGAQRHRSAIHRVTLDELLAAAARTRATGPDRSAERDKIATMLYTSGTTGRAKGAPSTAVGLIHNAQDLVSAWRFTADDALIHILPLFHVHGLFVAMHCALIAGSSVILYDRFEVGATIDSFARGTVLMGVPTTYTRLLASGRLQPGSVSGMRLFTSGSAPLSPATHAAFMAATGHRIVERYGLTETGILTSNPVGDEIPGTVGFALPHTEMRVAGPGGDARVAEPGEVQAHGPTVMPGYWRAAPDAPTGFTSDGFFRTGDVGVLDAAGRLSLLGRTKDVVISGGLNVYPAEIEAAVMEGEMVDEVAAIGVPHADFGEALVCVVVGPSGDTSSLDATVRQLAPYKRPKRWMVVDALPRNAMGKVQKHLLRERYGALFSEEA